MVSNVCEMTAKRFISMANIDHLSICSSCYLTDIRMANMDHLSICSSCYLTEAVNSGRGEAGGGGGGGGGEPEYPEKSHRKCHILKLEYSNPDYDSNSHSFFSDRFSC